MNHSEKRELEMFINDFKVLKKTGRDNMDRIGLSLLLILTLLLGGIFIPTQSNGSTIIIISRSSTIIVDKSGSGDYFTIQDALNSSREDDVIIIRSGVYRENLIITNNVSIRGSDINETIIKGNYHGIGIEASKRHLTIENLTITQFDTGMALLECHDSQVKNIRVKDTIMTGMFIGPSNNISINNNLVEFFTYVGISVMGVSSKIYSNLIQNSNVTINSPVGLAVTGSSNAIHNNTISNLHKGMGLSVNGENSTIYGNKIDNCSMVGLRSVNDAQNLPVIVQDNEIRNCGNGSIGGGYGPVIIQHNKFLNSDLDGIQIFADDLIMQYNIIDGNKKNGIVIGSLHIEEKVNITDNKVSNNGNSGIQLYRTVSTTIRRNEISNNYNGIEIFESDNSIIINNSLIENNRGVITSNSEGNKISRNQFISNNIQASTNSYDRWYQEYPGGGNYWSDHISKDVKKGAQQDVIGSDGICDDPYVINQTNQRDIYPIFKDTIPPVADAGPDITIGIGTIYHFTSENSHDDQLIHSAIWEWEYSGEVRKIEQLEFDFNFSIAGIYQVNLTVCDYAGNSDIDSIIITVKDIISPIAISQGNITIIQGENAYFDGTGSKDDGLITNYSWNFNYNNTMLQLYGAFKEFQFDIPGLYEVVLKVVDEGENFGVSLFTVEVLDNEMPSANAGKDIMINNGMIAEFNGTLSKDNGIITRFSWTFTYNLNLVELNGAEPTYTFVTPGIYVVLLTVFDEYNNTGTDYVKVTVNDTIDPIPVISGSLSLLSEESLKLSASGSTDNGIIVRYVWTFIDLEEIIIESMYLNYSFQRVGLITVNLKVYDQWNNSGSVNVTVDVFDGNSPIAQAGDDFSITTGEIAYFDGSGSTDDGVIVKYSWSLFYNGERLNLNGSKVNFTFLKTGEFIVTLTVFDQSGNYGEDTLNVIVTAPPSADDDVIGDDDTSDPEFPIVIVVIIGVIVLLVIIGLVVLILMKKKPQENDQPIEEEGNEKKKDLETMMVDLPPEGSYPSEQVPIVQTEIHPVQDQGDMFDDYGLPGENPEPIMDPIIEPSMEE